MHLINGAADYAGIRLLTPDIVSGAELVAGRPDRPGAALSVFGAVEFKREHSDMTSLRARLHHRLPPVVLGNGQMVMPAENDINPVGNAQQFQVLRKVVVGERDHNVATGVLQFTARQGRGSDHWNGACEEQMLCR